MNAKYEITWKSGDVQEVECDAMQQQGNTVLFLEMNAVHNAQGQVSGEIVLAANFLEMRCFKKVSQSGKLAVVTGIDRPH